LVEEQIEIPIPVRRLRYKDGREMALRGDDFIGLSLSDGMLSFVKGESKSRKTLTKAVIGEARAVLSRDSGRPTSISLLFVADRLMEQGGGLEIVGRAVRNEVAQKAVPPEQIQHVLFTFSGNTPHEALLDDLNSADNIRPHTVINFRLEDHQEFIVSVYEAVAALGDD
jgi:hypothetical protein